MTKYTAHEHYRELIWMLAKTDFKLRYQGSALGYVWALLKPLLMFTVLNFVFSSMFNPRNTGAEHYALQLLVAVVMMTFFNEGSTAAMNALVMRAQLVTKIYVPRWVLIISSTINSAMIYIMNLIVIVAFFAWYHFLPTPAAIGMFFVSSLAIYALIVAFGFLSAPLFVRFRDLSLIWEVLLQVLFFATPVFYSLTSMPLHMQQILLLNPMAFIIHFTKESLINGHFADPWQYALFFGMIGVAFFIGIWSYRRCNRTVAEYI